MNGIGIGTKKSKNFDLNNFHVYKYRYQQKKSAGKLSFYNNLNLKFHFPF